LRCQFGLDPEAKVKKLSRGECAKAGLLLALSHRPELLLLDEPSSGLDPVVRRDILEAIIRTVVDEGRTVLFSSHLLDEIERVSDSLAMMVNGRIVLNGSLDAIKQSITVFCCALPRSIATARPCGALSVSGGGREWTAICNGALSELTTRRRNSGLESWTKERRRSTKSLSRTCNQSH
jgi:ABC-2 type transport system ATP-binding protein